MNIIPTNLFLANLQPKKIYRLISEQLNNDIPHYYVCVSRNSTETILMVVCTTQFEKRKRFVESRNDIPNSTLVWVAPDDDNCLVLDSYIDCNTSFEFTISEIGEKYDNLELGFVGELSDIHYSQIVIGLHDSPLITEEVKDSIEDLDDSI